MPVAHPLPRWLSFAAYPLLLMINLVAAGVDVQHATLGRSAPYLFAFNVLSLLLLEFRYPMQQRWRMTWHTAKRDLFFMAIGIATLVGANWALTALAIALAPTQGWLSDMPVVPGAVLALLVIQFLQYWQHRWQHESCRVAWRIHRPHHVSERVYLLMHVRFHPLDGVLVRAVFILPSILLGLPAASLYVMSVIVGLQGFVSHLNVDLRAGWFNYVFTGTELHRYHHSAEIAEGKNYGSFLPIFDLLFGTFVYRPGQAPAALGVAADDAGPTSSAWLGHLTFPFSRAQRRGVSSTSH